MVPVKELREQFDEDKEVDQLGWEIEIHISEALEISLEEVQAQYFMVIICTID